MTLTWGDSPSGFALDRGGSQEVGMSVPNPGRWGQVSHPVHTLHPLKSMSACGLQGNISFGCQPCSLTALMLRPSAIAFRHGH